MREGAEIIVGSNTNCAVSCATQTPDPIHKYLTSQNYGLTMTSGGFNAIVPLNVVLESAIVDIVGVQWSNNVTTTLFARLL